MSDILVIGDGMLDTFTHGAVERLNPESPNPLLHVIGEEHKLGGSANVARNIASLSGSCDLLCAIGNDTNGKIFQNLLQQESINFFCVSDTFPTITKWRFIESTYHQQLLRVDYETPISLSIEDRSHIVKHLRTHKYAYIVISDYQKGLFSEALFREIQAITAITNTKILVDSKPKNYHFIENVFLLKPNFREFCEIIGQQIENTDANIEKYGRELSERKQSNIVVTRGEKGATLIEKYGNITHIPTQAKQVFDVTGAGDTFIATIAYALQSGKSLQESVQLGNIASGIVIGKIGTQTITKEEMDGIFVPGILGEKQ